MKKRAGLPDRWFAAWLASAAVAVVVSEQVPSTETVPFHVVLAGFALAYSRFHWPIRQTVVSLGSFYVVVVALFLRDALVGELNWTETLEVPITALLVTGVVWHVNRTQLALELVQDTAQRSLEQSRERERLTQLTSHAMRTPLTVVMGFLDLAIEAGVTDEVRGHLGATVEEVESLNRVVDRMVRAAHVREELPTSSVEVAPLLHGISARWQGVADRRWLVEADHLSVTASRERLAVALDTLVENAVRYTPAGGVVRLIGLHQDDWLLLGVADGGRGLPPDLRDSIDERVTPGEFRHCPGRQNVRRAFYDDPDAGTGLGLEIVRRSSHLRGGILVADRAPEGGAVVAMWIPLQPPTAPPGADASGRTEQLDVPDPSTLLRTTRTLQRPASSSSAQAAPLRTVDDEALWATSRPRDEWQAV